MPWPFHKDEPVGKPDKVVAIWTDTVATTAGQPPVRGFGGRLMFFEGNNDLPVKVEGTLIVYVFDETNRDPGNAKPDCKYVFTPEQLPKHYSKTKLGQHSYSFWIPWDLVGGFQKHFTLIVRFEPKNGPPVIGEQCKEMLPGPLAPNRTLPATGGPPGMMARNPANYGPAGGGYGVNAASYTAPAAGQASGVRQASFESPQPQYGPPAQYGPQPQYGPPAQNGPAQDGRARMTVSTIAVPDDLAVRQALSAPQVVPQAPNLGPQGQNFAPRAQNLAPQAPATGPQGPKPAYQWPAANPTWRNAPAPNSSPSAPPQAWPPQADLRLGRPWVEGEQLARLDRDRAPTQPPPAAPQYVPAAQPLPPSSNAGPAATSGGRQAQY